MILDECDDADLGLDCTICHKEFQNRKARNRHEKTCKPRQQTNRKANRNKKGPFECEECYNIIRRSDIYNAHLKAHAKENYTNPLLTAYEKVEEALRLAHFRKETKTLEDVARAIALNHSMSINEELIGQIL